MYVVNIATSRFGGAGRSAERLHAALNQHHIHSVLLTLDQPDKCDASLGIHSWHAWANKRSKTLSFRLERKWNDLRRKNNNQLKRLELFAKLEHVRKHAVCEIVSAPIVEIDLWNHPFILEADIVHFHWVSGLLDYPGFFKHCNKPVIFTFHDMQPMLGCFHYMDDQVRNRKVAEQLDKVLLEVKAKAIGAYKYPISIVSPSAWLAKAAQNSLVFMNKECKVIPYTLDHRIFHYREKHSARVALGLPVERLILLFVAENTLNYRKGFDLLLDALAQLDQQLPLSMLAIGHTKPIMHASFPLIVPGLIQDDHKLALYYAAADVFILPSREDNLPNTMLEALCCGTPVIAFPTGGMLEYIKNGVNGMLAGAIDAQALAACIGEWYESRLAFDHEAISSHAKTLFNEKKIVAAYCNEYYELSGKNLCLVNK